MTKGTPVGVVRVRIGAMMGIFSTTSVNDFYRSTCTSGVGMKHMHFYLCN